MSRHLIQQSRNVFSVPVFLAPAFSSSPCLSTARSFASSAASRTQPQRGNRDMNRKRGVSAIRSTGPRQPLRIMRLGPLPKPVADPSEARAAFETNPDHGLWGFFTVKKEAIIPAVEEDAHGRPWTKRELSRKGWHDLHRLYWTCIKEVNMVHTRHNERKRLRVGDGIQEGDQKIKNLKRTMHRIRQTLIDRHYATFDASLLLEEKPLYELFPDVIERYLPDERGPLEDADTETMPSINDSTAFTNLNATNAAISSDVPESPKRGERQKMTE